MKEKTPKTLRTFRLTDSSFEKLQKLADKLNVSQAQAVELSIDALETSLEKPAKLNKHEQFIETLKQNDVTARHRNDIDYSASLSQPLSPLPIIEKVRNHYEIKPKMVVPLTKPSYKKKDEAK